ETKHAPARAGGPAADVLEWQGTSRARPRALAAAVEGVAAPGKCGGARRGARGSADTPPHVNTHEDGMAVTPPERSSLRASSHAAAWQLWCWCREAEALAMAQ